MYHHTLKTRLILAALALLRSSLRKLPEPDVDQAAEETDFELGVDSKLVELFIQAVRENKVNAVVAKVNGAFDNYILRKNILVLWKNRLSTVLVQ